MTRASKPPGSNVYRLKQPNRLSNIWLKWKVSHLPLPLPAALCVSVEVGGAVHGIFRTVYMKWLWLYIFGSCNFHRHRQLGSCRTICQHDLVATYGLAWLGLVKRIFSVRCHMIRIHRQAMCVPVRVCVGGTIGGSCALGQITPPIFT